MFRQSKSGKLVRRHRYFTRLQARLMANHPEDSIIVTIEAESNSEYEDLGVQILNPEQLAQEYQVLKDKVGAMEAQMYEMMVMLQSLKSGTTAEGVAVVGPDGGTSFVPLPVSVNATATVPPESGVSNPVFVSGVNAPNQVTVAVPARAAGGPQIQTSSPPAALSPTPGLVAPPHNTPQPGWYYYGMGSHPQGHMFEGSQPNDPIRTLGERVRAMEGAGVRAKEACELCLVPDLVLPPKFKAPEVDQYRGTGRPVSRITMFDHKAQGYQHKKRTSFVPIPMTYTELFDYLTSKNLVNTRSMKPLQPPFPRSYNANTTCSFHENGVGHTVEECKAFKHVVQDLVEANWISFKQNGPSITANPLSGHERPTPNAIEDFTGQVIRKIVKIMMDQGYKVGSGLGISGQGILAPVQLKRNKDRCGLGYNPSLAKRRKMAEERSGGWLAESKGQDPWPQSIPVCDIRQSFVSAGLLNHNQVVAICGGSETEEGGSGLVRRCLAGKEVKNWEAADFP